jgi:hypothetical protein
MQAREGPGPPPLQAGRETRGAVWRAWRREPDGDRPLLSPSCPDIMVRCLSPYEIACLWKGAERQ